MHRLKFAPALLLPLAFLAGCITADGTVTADGAATLKLTYPTEATSDADKAARDAVTAPGVSIESLTIAAAGKGEKGPRRATAALKTDDVSKLTQLPLLVGLGVSVLRKPSAEGGASLAIAFRPNASKNEKKIAELNAHTATVRVHLPGPVTETSGTKIDDGVEWSFPAGKWAAGTLETLTVTYGSTPKPAE